MTVGGPEAFIPDAPAAETRIPLISDWSPSCCADAPMKSAVRCVISEGGGEDTLLRYGEEAEVRRAQGLTSQDLRAQDLRAQDLNSQGLTSLHLTSADLPAGT